MTRTMTQALGGARRYNEQNETITKTPFPVGETFVPAVPALSDSNWDGTSKGTGDNGLIDLPTVFGTPASATAVSVRLSMSSTSAGRSARLGTSSGDANHLIVRTAVSGIVADNNGIVPTDADGKIYFQASGTLTIYLSISGYFI